MYLTSETALAPVTAIPSGRYYRTPVFLHGMWRCGSTFTWSRFRELEATYCYFEPLIEGIARLTTERIARQDAGVIARNRHPSLGQPYHAEFEPLIEKRGVAGYRRDYANRDFILSPDEDHDRLKAYVDRLINFAHRMKCTPVLGFNRTVMRQAWFRLNFASFNIFIDRDPADIWASYAERSAAGDHTFFTRWLQLVDLNRHRAPFDMLAERLKLSDPHLPRIGSSKARYRAILAKLSDEETYFMVFTAWLYSCLQALSHADLILDMNQANDAHYVRGREHRIRQMASLNPDFRSLREAPAATDRLPSRVKLIEREALTEFPTLECAENLDFDRMRARYAELTPRKAALISALL